MAKKLNKMKQLFAIVSYYLFGYLIFWTFLHETNLFPKIWVEQNFTIAIYLWVFFFIIPLFLFTPDTKSNPIPIFASVVKGTTNLINTFK